MIEFINFNLKLKKVKATAMKTMTTFLVCISDEQFLKKFEMVFPVLLKTSVEAI